jgi:acetyl esterase/lipase
MLRFTPALVSCLLFGFAAVGVARAADTPAEYRLVKDVPYYEGEDADPIKHKLDLYLPKECKNAPVLFFVHGGGWVHGDKDFFGMYRAVGATFARQGICTVVTNYRLSPKVKHPEHIKDVAQAFAWTVKNIGKYGGDPSEIFACGHSAGGHLVSLLATDEDYLKATGLKTDALKGVIPISGVYRIPDPLFGNVFGTDATERKQAAPLSHVRAGLPPFLIVYADEDFPTCDQMSADFCRALKEQKDDAEVLEIKKRNHFTILLNIPAKTDPVTEAVVGFIRKHAKQETRAAE